MAVKDNQSAQKEQKQAQQPGQGDLGNSSSGGESMSDSMQGGRLGSEHSMSDQEGKQFEDTQQGSQGHDTRRDAETGRNGG